MNCSTCGAPIPRGRQECGTCGSAAARVGPLAAAGSGAFGEPAYPPAVQLRPARISVCPRCEYEGQGLPYFSRGPHVVGLVAATFFTLPFAFGAGGLLYYGLRHDHRVCPRCGFGWGKSGLAGIPVRAEARMVASEAPFPRSGGDGLMRAWSVMLVILGALLVVAGLVEWEALLVGFGLISAGGGFVLHRTANRLREKRREALLGALQLRVLKLAGERGGKLTVTEVAATLGWPIRRAEKVLQSLDDGWRIDSEVTDEGLIVYEFREILLGNGG